jgi:hypothetical protein
MIVPVTVLKHNNLVRIAAVHRKKYSDVPPISIKVYIFFVLDLLDIVSYESFLPQFENICINRVLSNASVYAMLIYHTVSI